MAQVKLKFIFIGLGLGLLSLGVANEILVPLAIVFAAFILGALLIYIKKPDNPKILFKIFTIGLVLRLLVCIFLAYISYFKRGHPFFLNADDLGFSLNALDMVRFWKETGAPPTFSSLWWMPYAGDLTVPRWISYLYYFVGEYRLMTLFMNCSFSAVSIILIYFVSQEIYNNHRIAISSALFFTFWPSLFLWSTQNLKEPLIILLILAVFLLTLKLRKEIYNLSYWLMLLICLYVFQKLTSAIFPCLALSVLICLPLAIIKKNLIYIVGVLFIISIFIINRWVEIEKFLSSFFNIDSSILNTINLTRGYRMEGADSAFLVGRNLSNPIIFILSLPELLFYIFFAPFPWQISRVSQLFSSFEMLLWIFLIPLAFKGLLITINKFKDGLIVIIFLGLIIIISFAEGNVGSIFRHRAFIWPCWHILISVGLFYNSKKSTKVQGIPNGL